MTAMSLMTLTDRDFPVVSMIYSLRNSISLLATDLSEPRKYREFPLGFHFISLRCDGTIPLARNSSEMSISVDDCPLHHAYGMKYINKASQIDTAHHWDFSECRGRWGFDMPFDEGIHRS
jgi:hypothetical protein